MDRREHLASIHVVCPPKGHPNKQRRRGWHNTLNRRAHGKQNLPMYLLINLLHREASLASLQIRLVSEGKLKRNQKKKYRDIQAKIFANWDQYDRDHNARRLLRASSHLCAGPRERVSLMTQNGSFRSHHMLKSQ